MTTTNPATTGAEHATRADLDTWGHGTTVILVHGSLATAAEEWEAQRTLIDEGFRFVAPNRRGYGNSPPADGEDFLRDADDVALLMDGGAHLVGHSYGGISVLLAAAERPADTLSVTVLEPAVVPPDREGPAIRSFIEQLEPIWGAELTDDEFVMEFLRAVGSDPDEFPPDFLIAARPLVPVFRKGRPFWDAVVPYDALAAAPFPKLVVSGAHHPGFDGICDDLARRISGSRMTIAGAGHEIQFAEQANETLLAFWRSSVN